MKFYAHTHWLDIFGSHFFLVIFSQTPQELYTEYLERLNNSGYSENTFASYGYDAVWTCALTLNASIDVLEKQNFKLNEFNYSHPNLSKVFVDVMKRISFAGMTVSCTQSQWLC